MFKKGSVLALTLLLLTMPLPVLASTPHSEKDVIRVNDTPAATNTVQFSRNQKNSTVDTTNLASALTTWDPVLMTYDTNLDVSWLFSKSVIANSFTDVTDVYPTYDVKAKIANNLIPLLTRVHVIIKFGMHHQDLENSIQIQKKLLYTKG